MSQVRSDRFRSLQHLISGAVLALKGFDKLQQSHLYIGAVLFALGIFVLAYFAFDRLTPDRGAKWLATIVHASEGFAFMSLAYLYFEEGKSYLPFAVLVAAVGFLAAALVHGLRSKRARHQLCVQDPDAAARFFVETLGFRRATQDGVAIVLRRPGIELCVFANECVATAGVPAEKETNRQPLGGHQAGS